MSTLEQMKIRLCTWICIEKCGAPIKDGHMGEFPYPNGKRIIFCAPCHIATSRIRLLAITFWRGMVYLDMSEALSVARDGLGLVSCTKELQTKGNFEKQFPIADALAPPPDARPYEFKHQMECQKLVWG